MNHRSAIFQGHAPTPAALGLLMLSVLLLSGCALTGKEPTAPAGVATSHIGRAPSPAAAQPDAWSGYRLYLEAMLARKADDFATAARYLEIAAKKDPTAVVLKRELAVVYLLANDKEKALEVIDAILKATPDDADSLLLLVRIRLTERKAKEAEALLQRVIASDPTREEAYYRLGMLQSSLGKMGNALDTYLKLLKEYPYSYAGHYYAALLYKEKGDLKNAEAHFKESLDIAPEFTESRLELADLLVTQKKITEAKAQYRVVLTHDPGNLQATLAMALIHQKSGEEEKARALFNGIPDPQNSWSEIYTLINRQYIERQRFDDAHRLMSGIMAFYRDLSEFNYMLGFVCEKLGHAEEALQCFTKIMPDSEYYERSILFVSVQLWEQDRKTEAIRTLEEARKNHPESVEILSYLASYYEESKQYDMAEARLLNAIEINAGDPTLHFRIGVLYDKWGKNDASTQAMKRALEIDPDDANALNYLGYTYARQGIHLEDAERLIKKALKQKPDDGYITDSLGWVYFQKGQFSQAVITLRKAASLLPEDPVVLEHLADALVKSNLTDEALRYYRQSLKQGHEDASAIQEKIRTIKMKPVTPKRGTTASPANGHQ